MVRIPHPPPHPFHLHLKWLIVTIEVTWNILHRFNSQKSALYVTLFNRKKLKLVSFYGRVESDFGNVKHVLPCCYIVVFIFLEEKVVRSTSPAIYFPVEVVCNRLSLLHLTVRLCDDLSLFPSSCSFVTCYFLLLQYSYNFHH